MVDASLVIKKLLYSLETGAFEGRAYMLAIIASPN